MQIQTINGFIPHVFDLGMSSYANQKPQPPIAFRMMWRGNGSPFSSNQSHEIPQRPAIILAPGFGSSLQTSPYMDQSLRAAAEMGCVAIGFNYSHTKVNNGQVDTGKLTCVNAENDVARVIEFAKNQSIVDKNALIGMGCSFGANTLLRMQPKDLSSYLLFSLVPDLVKPFREVMTPTKRWAWQFMQFFGLGAKQIIEGDVQEIHYHLFEQAEKIDLFERVKTIDKPVTIIQGTRDALAPVEDIRALQENMTQCPAPRVHFIENAGHAFACAPTGSRQTSEFQEAMTVVQESLAHYFAADIPEVTQKKSGNVFVPFLRNLQTLLSGWTVGNTSILKPSA